MSKTFIRFYLVPDFLALKVLLLLFCYFLSHFLGLIFLISIQQSHASSSTLQNSLSLRILSLLRTVLRQDDGVKITIVSSINLDQKYITLTFLSSSSFSSIALHFFLYILGTMSLLRKIVWSTQLRLALMFTLARTV